MKEVIRTCNVCHKKFNQENLKRVVYENNELKLANKKQSFGRGAYICSKDCLEKSLKQKSFNRAFQTNISEEVYIKFIEDYKQSL
ncbi:MAG: YlxR family protein [Clostridiales bacterium]|nr:YlxR family protein [Candidatus Apopatousia equi]